MSEIGRVSRWFPALQGDFLLFFIGQTISWIGTGAQMTGQAWLIQEVAHSPWWDGVVAGAFLLPAALLGPIGGTFGDRYDKKRLLYLTQLAATIQAFLLAFLTWTQQIDPLTLAACAVVLGVISGIDNPLYNGLVQHIVHKDNYHSATSLVGFLINAGILVGTALAGLLMVPLGLPVIFVANGLSFLVVILVIAQMKLDWNTTKTYDREQHGSMTAMIKSGAIYVFGHPVIRSLLGLIFVITLFGSSYRSILQDVVQKDYLAGGETFAFLATAPVTGIIAGCVIGGTAVFQRIVWRMPHVLITLAFVINGSPLVLAQWRPSVYTLWGLLCIASFGYIISFTIVLTGLRFQSRSDMASRVMGWYALAFFGGWAVGSFVVGHIAEYIGSVTTITGSGLVLLLAAILLTIRKNWLHSLFLKSDN